ncbi:MAG: GvpL/GvpF family gas vesicle protein [Chlamydiota bacterium]
MKEGKYIYCIIAAGKPDAFGPIGIGGRGDEVRSFGVNDVAAVVSNSPVKEYRVSRENTIAHEKAIEEVMKHHTVLPVRFGTIAESEDKMRKILEKEHDRFAQILRQMDGKKELGLKAVFKEEFIYPSILEKYEHIRRKKEKIANLPADKTHYQRMEIGRMVEEALGKEREEYREKMLEFLAPVALDTKINATYGERMVMNAAFLVEERREEEFDRAVEGLVEKYGETIKFKYVGTLPPFNFVNLVIETESY